MQGNAKHEYPASLLVVPKLQGLRSTALVRARVMPNPSFKGEAQRRATRPGPRVLAHFPRPRPGVPPLAPP
jgi:hypothetical protein